MQSTLQANTIIIIIIILIIINIPGYANAVGLWLIDLIATHTS